MANGPQGWPSCSRPRGGWGLSDALRNFRYGGINRLVSLLEEKEADRLGLLARAAPQKRSDCSYSSLTPFTITAFRTTKRPSGHFVGELAHRLRGGERIGIHCLGSIGRATITAACTLIELGWEPADALDAIEEARSCPVPDTEEQAEWILGYKARAGR